MAQAALRTSYPDQGLLPSTIQVAQKEILQAFCQASQTQSPDLILALFQRLFIDYTDTSAADLSRHLDSIITNEQPEIFQGVIRSVCYILVNTWLRQQQVAAICQLFELFDKFRLHKNRASSCSRRLRLWLRSFQTSNDFQTLKNYALGKTGWSQRYQAYLLVDQYLDSRNPAEHQDSARQLAQHLKYQFQFQLAKYLSLAQDQGYGNHHAMNPTVLGDAVISLIKYILLRRDCYSYEVLAMRFRQQTSLMTYSQYKQELLKYLSFALQHSLDGSIFWDQMVEQLTQLDSHHNHASLNDRLVMKTVKFLIDTFTIVQPHKPSMLFIQGAMEGKSFAMVTLLLKLVLVCPQSYAHLEWRLAEVIHCYQTLEESDCQWLIHFLELFQITFAIFTGYQQYSLVKVNHPQRTGNQTTDLSAYRIFAQQHKGMSED
jgi:hypothetical protein